jgi:hypothetical protein
MFYKHLLTRLSPFYVAHHVLHKDPLIINPRQDEHKIASMMIQSPIPNRPSVSSGSKCIL